MAKVTSSFKGAGALQSDITGLVNNFIDDKNIGRKDSVVEHKDASQLIAQLRDRLEKVPEGTDTRAVSSVVSQALASVLTMNEMVTVWAKMRNLDADQLVRNVDAGFGPIVAGPNRAAKVPGPKPTKLNAAGTLGFVRANITQLPSDLSIVPNHADDEPVGGIAQAWISSSQSLNQPNQLPTPPAEAKAFASSVWAFENGRDDQYQRSYARGDTVVAQTGLTERGVGPAYLAHAASVPSSSLRRSAIPEDGKAFAKHQQDRINFVQETLRKTLFKIKKTADSDPNLKPSADNPVRVTLPALSTGPEGALDMFESGFVLGTVLREFQEENPGYEFVVAFLPGSDTLEKDLSAFQAGFKPDAKVDNYNPRFETAGEVFDKVTQGFQNPVDDGVKLTDGYLDKKLMSWADNFLPDMDTATLNDRAVARTKFDNRVDTDAFHQISKALEIGPFAQKFGVSVADGQPISKDNIAKLLSNKQLRTEVFGLIKSRFAEAADSFGGNDKMPEIIAGAVAQVLQNARWNHLDAFQSEMQESLSAANDAVLEKQKALEDALGVKGDEIEHLKQQLLHATEHGADFEAEADKFEAEVKKLTKTNKSLTTKVDNLEDKIYDLKSQLSSAKSKASSYASKPESYSSSSYHSSSSSHSAG